MGSEIKRRVCVFGEAKTRRKEGDLREETQKARNYCERKEYVMRRDVWEAKSCQAENGIREHCEKEFEICLLRDDLTSDLCGKMFCTQLLFYQRREKFSDNEKPNNE